MRTRRADGLKGVASLDGIHRLIAYAIVALTVAGIGWSVIPVVGGRPGGPAFERFQAVVVSVLEQAQPQPQASHLQHCPHEQPQPITVCGPGGGAQ